MATDAQIRKLREIAERRCYADEVLLEMALDADIIPSPDHCNLLEDLTEDQAADLLDRLEADEDEPDGPDEGEGVPA